MLGLFISFRLHQSSHYLQFVHVGDEMIACFYLLLVRVRSVQQGLLPLFNTSDDSLLAFTQPILLFRDPLSMVDFIFFKLIFKLSFEVCFSHAVLLIVESLKIFLYFLNVFFELIYLLFQVLPLTLCLFLFLFNGFDFSISCINLLLQNIYLRTDLLSLSTKLVNIWHDNSQSFCIGKGLLQRFDL